MKGGCSGILGLQMIQDQEANRIYVTNIEAAIEEELVVITASGNNLSEQEINWEITPDDSDPLELTSTGPELTLSEENTALYEAASTVTAKVVIGEYPSEVYTLKEED
jgi:hypothetical protein